MVVTAVAVLFAGHTIAHTQPLCVLASYCVCERESQCVCVCVCVCICVCLSFRDEYRAEGISWHNIDYIDNTGCINLISKKPTALLHLLDEECKYTLLDKFKRQHEGNSYIEFPAVMESAFIIRHYAGKVKYGVKDFREKNTDHMRPDIVALLKSSKNAFICGLMGIDPVATFRWAVLRAYFRAMGMMLLYHSVDSFSFLHHPVHQRSLEILQRCKDEKYSKKLPQSSLLPNSLFLGLTNKEGNN
ncbi:unnamed protein product [Coregonus sp. 'balchen']|nr:unnamed protein product [Coregonus sp. 'balchen']